MTQETLEELAEKLQEEIKYGASISDIIDTLTKWQQQNSNVNALHFEIDSLKREIKVLKHQQERSYSEEEVKIMYRSLWVGNCFDFDTSYEMETNFEHDFNLWFEQFKNK
jgi:predicted CopG family antitoxin